MNVNSLIKKLQKAILYSGLVIKINTRQFYSEDQNRMITIWSITTPTLQNTKNGTKMKDFEILSTSSGIDIVKCLSEIYQQIRGG